MNNFRQKNVKALIAGATGFTGRHIVSRMVTLGNKYVVSIFARDIDKVSRCGFNLDRIRLFKGDFEHPDFLRNALAGQDVFICAASLGFGHAPEIVAACKDAGVQRVIFISTTGIFTSLDVRSKKVRMDAEIAIKQSNLDWTIIRPTMIFGAPGDRNIERLIRYVSRWPAIAIPGPGTFLMQPVYVNDLANAIIQTIDSSKSIGQEYNISGKDVLSYNKLILTIAELMYKRIVLVHVPLPMMKIVFQFYVKFSKKPKITVEQLLRLNEDKAFSHDCAVQDFGYNPTLFRNAVGNEIKELMESREK